LCITNSTLLRGSWIFSSRTTELSPPMKPLLFRFLLPLLVLSLPLKAADQSFPTLSSYFSPNGGCTQAVVDILGSANTSILVQAYSFTSAPIAKALVDAHKRGLDVQAILDKSQRTESVTQVLGGINFQSTHTAEWLTRFEEVKPSKTDHSSISHISP
jgi:phosphatidylserine/phosphatidylglycerophosphate/cardiolipin synthase-like enzyme